MGIFRDRVAGTPVSSFADEPGKLRLLAGLQDELAGAVDDDLPAVLLRVAACAQELVGASGATLEIVEPGGAVARVATGSGRASLGSAPVEGADGAQPARADDSHSISENRMTVAICTPRAQYGCLALLVPRRRKFQPEDMDSLRIVAGSLAARLESLEQLHEREVLSAENAIAIGTLRESESRFRNAFDDSGIGMALQASDGRWLKVNAALCRTLGRAAAELLSRDTRSVTHPDDVDLEPALVARLLAGELEVGELEKRYVHRDGSIVWGLLTLSLVRDGEGQALYLVSQIQDISARKASEETLKRLAIRDSLTGLFNRGELDRLLDEEIARARRHGRTLSLVMVDVDRFKQVNDTCGHPAGDRALRDVANVLSACVRSHDPVGRYGGEEFAIILPETTAAEALVVAERMRARVAAEVSVPAPEGHDEARRPITISLGIATLRTDGKSRSDQLVRDADHGLYAAKHGGRNRCVVMADGLRVD